MMQEDEMITVPPEFLAPELGQTRPKTPGHKSGPYSKAQREKRRAEVYKLHFDYGYSARKISQMMKINRHTIDSDIKNGYTELSKEWERYDTESWYMRQISRMESQRTRLIEDLEKSDDAMKKLAIEKTILDIDNKIMHGVAKISLNSESMMNAVINFLNNWSEKNKVDIGFIEERSLLKTSTKTRDKIIKLIQEDTKNKNGIVREF